MPRSILDVLALPVVHRFVPLLGCLSISVKEVVTLLELLEETTEDMLTRSKWALLARELESEEDEDGYIPTK